MISTSGRQVKKWQGEKVAKLKGSYLSTLSHCHFETRGLAARFGMVFRFGMANFTHAPGGRLRN
jgi:hypothetical protein